ncbi:MAG TPA: carbohydrate ABC transporter permease [Polyangia bacterium]|nr:carbohydrate ABC transporter permease [Polyangia bacterium]
MNALRFILLALAATFLALLATSIGAPARRSRALRFGRRVLLGLACVTVLGPFVWLVAAIFKDRTVLNEYLFFPPLGKWSHATMNLDNFRELLRGRETMHGPVRFWQYVLNSVVYATVGTTCQLILSSLAGYALAKYRFKGKNALMLFMLGSMMIPQVLLLAPLYKMAVDLGMVDSLAGLLLPWLVNAYGIFLFRQACVAVPDELIDAGRIDGCGEFGIYFRLVMPLVRPMAAAFCLVSFLSFWNAFFAPNIFLHSQDKLTLPVVLQLYLNQYKLDYGVFLAGTALAMLPPAILFLALQKEFISGLTSGAVKG